MQTEISIYYHSYEGDKPKYKTYAQRIRKMGLTKEQAIKLKLPKKYKHSTTGRQCSKCKKSLPYICFHYDKRKKDYKSACKKCIQAIRSKKYHENIEEMRAKRREEKKRHREANKDLLILDNIYYKDPIIKQNNKIRGRGKRGDAREKKYWYFLNKGFDKKWLIEKYKFTRLEIYKLKL